MPNEVKLQSSLHLYKRFDRLNYKAWFAIGELVDNAINSWLKGGKPKI